MPAKSALFFWLAYLVYWVLFWAPRNTDPKIWLPILIANLYAFLPMVRLHDRYLVPKLWHTRQFSAYGFSAAGLLIATILAKRLVDAGLWLAIAKLTGVSLTRAYYGPGDIFRGHTELVQSGLLLMAGSLILNLAQRGREASEAGHGQHQPVEDVVFFKVDGQLKRLQLRDIYIVEAMRDYVKVMGNHGQLVVKQTMKHMAAKLPKPWFIRIHKSHIINIQHVEALGTKEVQVQGKWLKIGDSYRQEFLDLMNRRTFP